MKKIEREVLCLSFLPTYLPTACSEHITVALSAGFSMLSYLAFASLCFSFSAPSCRTLVILVLPDQSFPFSRYSHTLTSISISNFFLHPLGLDSLTPFFSFFPFFRSFFVRSFVRLVRLSSFFDPSALSCPVL